MDPNVAQRVFRECLGCRAGERILVVTDEAMHPAGAIFFDGARAIDLRPLLLTMCEDGGRGEEPPEQVAAALLRSDAAILVTRESLARTQARRRATAAGVRIVGMPGVDPARLAETIAVDYDELSERTRRLADLLRGGGELRITSPAGTDLRVGIRGRAVFAETGLFREPGAFGNLPAGEVRFAPAPGTLEGVLVVDGSMAGIGIPDRPFRIRFERGVASEIGSDRLRLLLEPFGPDALRAGEVGIGTNPRAAVVGNPLEDEKSLGTAHVALGHGASSEGDDDVPLHLGAVFRDPALTLDGTPIPAEVVRGGHSPPDPAPPLPAPPLEPEAFRGLFLDSNDPQYVLDGATGRFVEVNPKLESLLGFTRAELLSGRVKAWDLVAPEHLASYRKRLERRSGRTSDRYTLNIRTKSGCIRHAEFSVRAMAVGARRYVVGSIRDRTEHDEMQKNLWEKIRELGSANLRINLLTEKIRHAPRAASRLLEAASEAELLERAGKFLCERAGPGLTDVTFYMVRGFHLEPAFTTLPKAPRRHDLRRGHPLARIVRGEIPPPPPGSEVVLPIRGRNTTLGVLRGWLDPQELQVLQASEAAFTGYLDVLATLAYIIGLSIENLNLFETVKIQSVLDPLTNVFNRRMFDQQVKTEFRRARRYRRPLSVVLLDLDGFKEINDTWGHAQGDSVLRELARLLQKSTRDVDFVCRYGGDEFLLLLPETTLEQALVKGEHLRRDIAAMKFTSLTRPRRPLRLTASIGVASVGREMEEQHLLVQAADEALYRAKRAGRDCVRQ